MVGSNHGSAVQRGCTAAAQEPQGVRMLSSTVHALLSLTLINSGSLLGVFKHNLGHWARALPTIRQLPSLTHVHGSQPHPHATPSHHRSRALPCQMPA